MEKAIVLVRLLFILCRVYQNVQDEATDSVQIAQSHIPLHGSLTTVRIAGLQLVAALSLRPNVHDWTPQKEQF